MKEFTIGVLSFNTSGNLYGDKTDPHGTIRKFAHKVYNANIIDIDFIENAKTKFINTDILVVALQESGIKNPKTFLCSDQLLQKFAKDFSDTHYLLLKKKKAGVGAEGIRGLRIGILVNNNIIFNVRYEYLSYSPLKTSILSASEGQQYGKGSIGIKLNINNYLLTIINSHFPFNGNLQDQGKSIRDITFSETLNFYQQHKFLDNPYIFVGDLNYRVVIPELNNIITENEFNALFSFTKLHNTYSNYDTLKQTLNNRLFLPYNLREGVNSKGIYFMPTSKLHKIKDRKYAFSDYKVNKEDQERTPSWTDRILYNSLHCLMYDRFDYGNIALSDHAGVIGVFSTY